MAKPMIADFPSSVSTDPSRPPFDAVGGLQNATIVFLREVFELPPEAVLLPGSGGSLGCSIANTLRAWGVLDPWVMKTRMRYSSPDGQRKTVLFNAHVKRWIAIFDMGRIPELVD